MVTDVENDEEEKKVTIITVTEDLGDEWKVKGVHANGQAFNIRLPKDVDPDEYVKSIEFDTIMATQKQRDDSKEIIEEEPLFGTTPKKEQTDESDTVDE